MVFIVKIPGRSRATTPEVNMGTESQDATASMALASANLDVLVAPSVLHHRYVRGVDKSLIVERPERIRAVLLGIAAAIGKESSNRHPPLPVPNAGVENKDNDDDDDLVAKLETMSMGSSAPIAQQQRFRVLQSTRSISLDPPHPAVAFTHAHADDQVTLLESAYQQARQKRKNSKAQYDALPDPALPAAAKIDRDTTPVPASMPVPEPEPKPILTSHAAYLEYLCDRAPNQPPISQAEKASRRSTQNPEDSEAYTSPDGEGDDAIHASEIPEHLPQGDLYLAGPRNQDHDGGSAEAIRHAMGACCEAVDRVVAAASSATTESELEEIGHDIRAEASLPSKRVFVLSRPPGHHCAGSTPSGFCWVNNAVVASAHAYLTHSIDRVVVFDIDLHHGNGTQTLAWRINSDANKHDDARFERISRLRHAALDRLRAVNRRGARVAISEQEDASIQSQAGKRALRMFYGSIHDIESYPCEDGDPALVRDASTCVEGAHGQWIWNIHLDTHSSEQDFARVYQAKYSALFSKAARFLTATKATPERTLVLISAGFDACAYEYPGMQRHGKSVPPSFYHRFARDAVAFADQRAQGKVVSVLEGGYSDRALCSAAMAHVTGLASASTGKDEEAEHEYWKLENLIALEKMAKKMAANAAAAAASVAVTSASTNTTPKRRQAELPPWLTASSKAFATFEQACGKQFIVPVGMPISGSGRMPADAAFASTFNSPAAGRVLRDRKLRAGMETPVNATPVASARKAATPGATPTSPVKKRVLKKEGSSDNTIPPTPSIAAELPTNTRVKNELPNQAERVSDSPPLWSSSDLLSPTSTAPLDHLRPLSTSPTPGGPADVLDHRGGTPSSISNMSLDDSVVSPPAPLRLGLDDSSPGFKESRVGARTPTDHGLTAKSVVLVDAMSMIHVVDRNTASMETEGGEFGHGDSSDLQLTGSDDRGSYDIFDEDAPGSPDPRYTSSQHRFMGPPASSSSAGAGKTNDPRLGVLGLDELSPRSSPRKSGAREAGTPLSPAQRQEKKDIRAGLYTDAPLPFPPMRFAPHRPPTPE